MHSLAQKWLLVLSFLFGVPALLVWACMPFLDMSHATYLTATKDYRGAIRSLDRAILFNNILPSAYIKRGYVYARMGETDKALADYAAAQRLSANDWMIYNNRASLLLDKKQVDAAFADAQKAVELCPQCAPPFETRGSVYSSLGENEKAVADFTRAIELDNNFTDAYVQRAAAYEALGNAEAARADLNKAQELGYVAPR